MRKEAIDEEQKNREQVESFKEKETEVSEEEILYNEEKMDNYFLG